MRPRLTQRQDQAFEFIRSYIRQHRRPPTMIEIGSALEIRSTNAVHKLIRSLETKGYLTREPNAARGLSLVEVDQDPFGSDGEIPQLMLISRTPSNEPEKLRMRPSGYVSIDPRFLHDARDTDRCLIGRAGDDGMNGEGIRKGDFVVVEEVPWQELHNGEPVAVLLRDVFYVRRFFFANGRIHLRPADRTYTDETFSPTDPACYVVGRVLALMRRYQY